MRIIKSGLLLLLNFPLLAQVDDRVYFETTKKNRLHYIVLVNDTALVYQMGKYYDKVGWGYSIMRVDTLFGDVVDGFKGKSYSFKEHESGGSLLLKNGMKIGTELTNSEKVNRNLNNAYYLKRYFELSNKLNDRFPLFHYTFRNGYYGWEKLDEKTLDHKYFRLKINSEVDAIYDSIVHQQSRPTNTFDFILKNVAKVDYAVLRDSLKVLPIAYRSTSWYFGEAVYQVSKVNPEYFFKIAEDFPSGQEIVFSAVSLDKELVKRLKNVAGYSNVKGEFLKYCNTIRKDQFVAIGTYILCGGVLVFLIFR